MLFIWTFDRILFKILQFDKKKEFYMLLIMFINGGHCNLLWIITIIIIITYIFVCMYVRKWLFFIIIFI